MESTSRDLAEVLQPKHTSRRQQITYLGDYPIDRLPSTCPSPPYSLVVNCDREGEPGSHWFAIALVRERNLLFIEPIGLGPLLLASSKPLQKWVKDRGGDGACATSITHMPYGVQPLHSTLCGAYCAYILSRLPLYNYQLESLVRGEFLPEPHTSVNDRLVARWWYKRRDANA